MFIFKWIKKKIYVRAKVIDSTSYVTDLTGHFTLKCTRDHWIVFFSREEEHFKGLIKNVQKQKSIQFQ